jgi:predicted molibdopterin-dependent oxidoreductase YjgC
MADSIHLTIDGKQVSVPAGITVIAAIAIAARREQPEHGGAAITRRSVTGGLRGPLCGMGICQECRVTIDGRAHQLACQTPCAPGMRIQTALAKDAA